MTLVEELRLMEDFTSEWSLPSISKACGQAASRIEALEAENRRMREALADAVEKYGKPGGPWNVPSEPGSWIVKARAALEGEKP